MRFPTDTEIVVGVIAIIVFLQFILPLILNWVAILRLRKIPLGRGVAKIELNSMLEHAGYELKKLFGYWVIWERCGGWVVKQVSDSLLEESIEDLHLPVTGPGDRMILVEVSWRDRYADLVDVPRINTLFDEENFWFFVKAESLGVSAHFYDQTKWVKYDPKEHAGQVWKFQVVRRGPGDHAPYALLASGAWPDNNSHRDLEMLVYKFFLNEDYKLVVAGNMKNGEVAVWDSVGLNFMTPYSHRPLIEKILTGCEL